MPGIKENLWNLTKLLKGTFKHCHFCLEHPMLIRFHSLLPYSHLMERHKHYHWLDNLSQLSMTPIEQCYCIHLLLILLLVIWPTQYSSKQLFHLNCILFSVYIFTEYQVILSCKSTVEE